MFFNSFPSSFNALPSLLNAYRCFLTSPNPSSTLSHRHLMPRPHPLTLTHCIFTSPNHIVRIGQAYHSHLPPFRRLLMPCCGALAPLIFFYASTLAFNATLLPCASQSLLTFPCRLYHLHITPHFLPVVF